MDNLWPQSRFKLWRGAVKVKPTRSFEREITWHSQMVQTRPPRKNDVSWSCTILYADISCLPTETNGSKRQTLSASKKKSTQFENFYVGSMPCMPARREMHTGRYNFLHRSWGPLEPFDDSMPAFEAKWKARRPCLEPLNLGGQTRV